MPPDDPLLIALEDVKRDVAEVRRALEGDSFANSPGLIGRLGRAEERIGVIEQIEERRLIERKVYVRIGGIAITFLGLISSGALLGVIRILQLLAGGATP